MSIRKYLHKYLKRIPATSEEIGLVSNDQISQQKRPESKRVQQNKFYHSLYSNGNVILSW